MGYTPVNITFVRVLSAFWGKLGYTPVVKPFLRFLRAKGEERCIHLPTKDTKTITLRVPNRVDFGDVNLHKFITNLYDMVAIGAVEIIEDELIMPKGDDMDGDWLREYAHDVNLPVDVVKRKMEQMKGW